MIPLDRHLTLLAIGLALAGSLTGCRAPQYGATATAPQGPVYAVAPAPQTPSGPAYVRGPSEPAPLGAPATSFHRELPPPPSFESERTNDRGPFLRGLPEGATEDDEPVFPGPARGASNFGAHRTKFSSGAVEPDARKAARTSSSASVAPFSAAHKALGSAAASRRSSSQPPAATRLSANDELRPPRQGTGETALVEHSAEPEAELPTSSRPERVSLPLTSRERSARSHRPPADPFEDPADACSEPILLAEPPILLTPPAERS